MPHKHGKPLPFSQPLASRREACFPTEGSSRHGVGVGALRGSLYSPGLSPQVPSPGLHLLGLVKREGGGGGTLLGGRSGAFSALALLSRLAKSHELANWRSAFKAGLRPPWQMPQSRLALLCLCLGVCTGHLFTRLSGGIPGSGSQRHSGSSAG